MKYYICGYCGKIKSIFLLKKRPKCGCAGGGGKTFMSMHDKKTFKSWKKNLKVTKKLKKEAEK